MQAEPTIDNAAILQPCHDMQECLTFFIRELGFRLEKVYPADNPRIAVLLGYGLRLRLDTETDVSPGVLVLQNSSLEPEYEEQRHAPNGTIVRLVGQDISPPLTKPKMNTQLITQLYTDQWQTGRVGMQYRDLIPNRLNGEIIASNIRIPGQGPVTDNVHYHEVGFQLIFCYKGWVKVVYEDQGEPIVLRSGDCVTQPPEIRHRVLESGDDLEVIEIGIPSVHMTALDHLLKLPTKTYNPQRNFSGQTFCHFQLENAQWQSSATPGFATTNTGVDAATGGIANVRLIAARESIRQTPPLKHGASVLFLFVLRGQVQLLCQGKKQWLQARDSCVLPAGNYIHLQQCSGDLQLLEVTLPEGADTLL